MRKHLLCWMTLILVLLLAFQLRVWQLDALALWFDEGVSITFAITPLSDVAVLNRLFEDTNPPAYRVLLGFLLDVFGVNAFTARYVSVLFGILSVALAYALVQAFRFRRQLSIIVLTVMAFAPMQVFYSREAKGYTLVQFCVLLVALLWLRMFPLGSAKAVLPDTPLKRIVLWLAISLPTAIGFGSHYVSSLMFITINMWLFGWLINYQHVRPSARPIPKAAEFWLSAQIAGALVWIPWLLATGDRALAGAQSAVAAEGVTGRPLHVFLEDMLSELVAGPTVDLAVGIVFFLVGFMGISLIENRSVRWVLASWLFWPLVLGFGMQQIVPFFFPRFLMFLSPGLFIAVAYMLTRQSSIPYQVAQGAFAIGAVSLFATGLLGIYRQPDPLPDLREPVAQLEESLSADHAVIYSYSWQPGMVEAYLAPSAVKPRYYASFFDPERFDQQLRSILEGHQQTWLLTYQIGAETPSNDVGNWLLENAATTGSRWFGETQLTAFLPPESAQGEQGCHSFRQGSIALCTSTLSGSRQAATELQIQLEWQTSESLDENLISFIHLLDGQQQAPVAQSDGLPANGLRPAFTWEPDERIVDRRVFTLPAVAGNYELCAGLYDAASQERVPFDGDGYCAPLGSVTVR